MAAGGQDALAAGTSGAPGRGARGVWVAVGVVSLQALTLLAVGAWLLVQLALTRSGNARVASGSGAYFILVGFLVGWLALLVGRRHPRAYAPAVFLQALALAISWSMVEGGFAVGAAVLSAAAAAALIGLLSREARAEFGR